MSKPEPIAGIVEELRECPFCGGPAELRQHHDYHTGKPIDGQWWALCPPCDLFPAQAWCVSKVEAAAAWNTRTADQHIERLTSALEEYADHRNWHWNGGAWEWNGPNSGQFRGAPSDSAWAYPPQECVDAECGSIARTALSLMDKQGKSHG